MFLIKLLLEAVLITLFIFVILFITTIFILNKFKSKKEKSISKKKVKKIILTTEFLNEDKKYSSISEKKSFFEFKDELKRLYNGNLKKITI